MSGVHRSASVVVSTVHNQYDEYAPHWKMSEYVLLRTSDVVVAVSDKVHESVDFLGGNVETFRNVIETNRFKNNKNNDSNNIRGEMEIGPSDKVIVTVGSLAEQKGHKHLIRAVDIAAPYTPARGNSFCTLHYPLWPWEERPYSTGGWPQG